MGGKFFWRLSFHSKVLIPSGAGLKSGSFPIRTDREELASSTHRWGTLSPACFQHRLPGFDGVVTQHPPTCHWLGWLRRPPQIRAQCHPLAMGRWSLWPELHDPLLIDIHQPAFSSGFVRRWAHISVKKRHACDCDPDIQGQLSRITTLFIPRNGA